MDQSDRSLGVEYWRAREASETLSRVYKFELMRYIYIYREKTFKNVKKI